MGQPKPSIQVRDRSLPNSGGVLTNHRAVPTPDNFPNAENGESNEPEHKPEATGITKMRSVATTPGLMQAHQRGSISAADSDAIHGKCDMSETNGTSAQADLAPGRYQSDHDQPGTDQGNAMSDVQSILGKARGPVTAYPPTSAYSNTTLRDNSDGRAPLHAPVVAKLGSHPSEAKGAAVYKG